MPIYVYRCRKCEAVEEHIQRFSDPPMTECSSCGGPLEKAITSAAFHLKGGGWYADGYASARPGDGGSSSDSGGGSDSTGSSDAGSSAKPAASSSSDSGGAKDTSKPAAKPKKKAGGGAK